MSFTLRSVLAPCYSSSLKVSNNLESKENRICSKVLLHIVIAIFGFRVKLKQQQKTIKHVAKLTDAKIKIVAKMKKKTGCHVVVP